MSTTGDPQVSGDMRPYRITAGLNAWDIHSALVMHRAPSDAEGDGGLKSAQGFGCSGNGVAVGGVTPICGMLPMFGMEGNCPLCDGGCIIAILRQQEQPLEDCVCWPGWDIPGCACTGVGLLHIIPPVWAGSVLVELIAAACCIMGQATAGAETKAPKAAVANKSFFIGGVLSRPSK